MSSSDITEKLETQVARLTDYHGGHIVAGYSDPRKEFSALRSACGLYDLGWRVYVTLSGRDRVRWLNGMITNNIRDLVVGQGVYAFVLNPQGHILGDLYAFGLLGTFVLTCVSLDVVRWHEREHWTAGHTAIFVIGVLTTFLVLVAWTVNLVAKPYATAFGGGLTVIGLIIGLATYRYSRRHRPAVFPVPFRPQRARASIASALGGSRSAGEVLVILPHEQLAAEADPQDGPGIR